MDGCSFLVTNAKATELVLICTKFFCGPRFVGSLEAPRETERGVPAWFDAHSSIAPSTLPSSRS